MAKATAKKRKVIVESTGEAHISATFNNIIISLTNKKGEVISWSSAGKMGFRGSKKNTPYAAQMAAEDCSKVALEAGLKKVKVSSATDTTPEEDPLKVSVYDEIESNILKLLFSPVEGICPIYGIIVF